MSESMIEYATKKSAHKKITYEVCDVFDMSQLYGGQDYDKAFSFFFLHWVKAPITALKEIAECLATNGQVFHVFAVSFDSFNAYRQMATNPKWAKYMQEDVEQFIGPYHDSKNPVEDIRGDFRAAGYEVIYCEVLYRPYKIRDRETAKRMNRPCNPWLPRIPKDQQETFLEEMVTTVLSFAIKQDEGYNACAKLAIVYAQKKSDGAHSVAVISPGIPDNILEQVHRVLVPDGQIFFVFLTSFVLWDAYRRMARSSKWRTYMNDVELVVGPYHDSKDRRADIVKDFSNVGFDVIVCDTKDITTQSKMDFYGTRAQVKSVNPWLPRVPESDRNEFLDELVMTIYECMIKDNDNHFHENCLHWSTRPEKILDLGCGPGDTTKEILLPTVPQGTRIVAIDSSRVMIEYARTHYYDAAISYEISDARNLVTDFVGEKFNKCFSFYSLHWMTDSKDILEQVHRVLVPDGQIFFVFLTSFVLWDAYRRMARSSKWRTYMNDVELVVGPYHDSKDRRADIVKDFSNVGFDVIVCDTKDITTQSKMDFYGTRAQVKSVNPWLPRVPESDRNEFLDELVMTIYECMIKDNDNHFVSTSSCACICARSRSAITDPRIPSQYKSVQNTTPTSSGTMDTRFGRDQANIVISNKLNCHLNQLNLSNSFPSALSSKQSLDSEAVDPSSPLWFQNHQVASTVCPLFSPHIAERKYSFYFPANPDASVSMELDPLGVDPSGSNRQMGSAVSFKSRSGKEEQDATGKSKAPANKASRDEHQKDGTNATDNSLQDPNVTSHDEGRTSTGQDDERRHLTKRDSRDQTPRGGAKDSIALKKTPPVLKRDSITASEPKAGSGKETRLFEDAAMYAQGNVHRRREATWALEEFAHHLTWSPKPETVLDLGCGPGNVTEQILLPGLPTGTEVVAVDRSASMIEYAKKNHPSAHINYVVGEARTLSDQFAGTKFNKCFSFNFFHWIREPQAVSFKSRSGKEEKDATGKSKAPANKASRDEHQKGGTNATDSSQQDPNVTSHDEGRTSTGQDDERRHLTKRDSRDQTPGGGAKDSIALKKTPPVLKRDSTTDDSKLPLKLQFKDTAKTKASSGKETRLFEDAAMYAQGNVHRRREATWALEEFAHHLTWSPKPETVLDLGCGPGNVTEQILLPGLPTGTEVVAVDRSASMIEYAKKNHPSAHINYVVGEARTLSDQFAGTKFNKCFSFNFFHWIREPQVVLKEIKKCLTPDGQVFHFFIVATELWTAFRQLAKDSDWKPIMKKDVEDYICVYFDSTNPKSDITKDFIQAGYEVALCEVVPRSYSIPNMNVAKLMNTPLNPWVGRLPANERDRYMNDLTMAYLSLLTEAGETYSGTTTYAIVCARLAGATSSASTFSKVAASASAVPSRGGRSDRTLQTPTDLAQIRQEVEKALQDQQGTPPHDDQVLRPLENVKWQSSSDIPMTSVLKDNRDLPLKRVESSSDHVEPDKGLQHRDNPDDASSTASSVPDAPPNQQNPKGRN
ncbi:unnamed protein product [Cyprideis torosa]|uniref:Uncharacterized protein n=1 Tax=Cyprideis torosa TaxID=163714 RepID=A0A7R8WBL4_9CRUS|nr:unnamed protein product [Cyprideis torosa]CAG0892385.1 unnamed protein product [Cyprideis torosa]